MYRNWQRPTFLTALDQKMGSLARKDGEYESVLFVLRTAKSCEMTTSDGLSVLYDYGHLTIEGSIRVANYLPDHRLL